jgi:hypothetical protein
MKIFNFVFPGYSVRELAGATGAIDKWSTEVLRVRDPETSETTQSKSYVPKFHVKLNFDNNHSY